MGKGFLAGLALLLSACSQSPQHHQLALTRLQLGLAYLDRSELESAGRNLGEAMRLSPDDYRTYLAMARYQERLGHEDTAQRYYQHALRLAGSNHDVINNYGAFLCRLGQYDAAQRQFSRAAELSANDSRADVLEVLENAGYCYLRAGNRQEAEVALIKATRNDPHKGQMLLAEAERRFENNERDSPLLLLKIYQHNFPASAESLWLEIRFAAQARHPEGVMQAGEQLARNFPQSIQYLHFLANEY
ncbi:type IV pilus biogenesis/stability protein PilW [Erwinia tracheiphila]|uniref:Type IV pilus biogenesis/stability protein PilW n=1 Tax=Erwinia tracheiphila TaxID=65700 RepID=A0A345CNI2_9GAMM|nr:type IV pilus biogenesis/stability protein PilW [Erwinia tracheiphila]AXF74999.1 type IV pilus biogenesis/stability protein PilW [Erwinia tracheiphila]UIA82463.1 type IV pilus biogenesis/stability protein PilW [Erwinia tracheiphila]UIA91052.1 type IV pilus biogenesis/stability protein PilW [Erwinia tracheiphila]